MQVIGGLNHDSLKSHWRVQREGIDEAGHKTSVNTNPSNIVWLGINFGDTGF